MKIQIELVSKTFLFIEDFGLTRFDGAVEVDLSERSDQFKATIAAAIAAGTIKSDCAVEPIVELINDNALRNATKINLGLADFSDVVVSKPEIVEVEMKQQQEEDKAVERQDENNVEEQESSSNDDEEKEEEGQGQEEEDVINTESVEDESSNMSLDDQVLSVILEGRNADVIEKMENANITLEQAKHLLELEEAGRNRRNIKRRIDGLIEKLSGE